MRTFRKPCIAGTFLLVVASATACTKVLHASPPNTEPFNDDGLRIETPDKLNVEYCTKGACIMVPLPDSLRKMSESFDLTYSYVDINGDDTNDLIVTSAEEGQVNKCSRLYIYKKSKNSLSDVITKNQICNLRIIGNTLFSNYRQGAKWREDTYSLKNGQPKILTEDECVGCGQISRTIYKDGIASKKVLVADTPDYNSRTPLSSQVLTNRAWIFKHPDISSKSKSYLVRGDTVKLLEFTSNDNYWYLVEYVQKNGNSLNGWIPCPNLRVCEDSTD